MYVAVIYKILTLKEYSVLVWLKACQILPLQYLYTMHYIFSPQVFVFDVGGKAWKFYDWSHVTTVAAFGKYDAELMCYAHSKGARLVLKGRGFCKYASD